MWNTQHTTPLALVSRSQEFSGVVRAVSLHSLPFHLPYWTPSAKGIIVPIFSRDLKNMFVRHH